MIDRWNNVPHFGDKMLVEISKHFLYNETYEYILRCYGNSGTEMTSPVLDEHSGAHVAELFRAFSDTRRVRIMSALLNGEKNVGTLAQLVGITESAVSHHMRGLRQTHIVTARRDGKEVYYSITDSHIVTLFTQGVRHVQEK
jgi:DNA-binding transcriptional ArsR family regulator